MAHDWRTARWLARNHRDIDLVHAWPGAAIQTIRTAKRFGIPCLLERPNTHTEYAFEAAAQEAEYCGVTLPKGHDHSFDATRLKLEITEYEECDYLLCPSDFVKKTFTDRGTPEGKILRHHYGFDPLDFHPSPKFETESRSGFTAIYAGACEPRKGLHYLLEAWFRSGVEIDSRLRICGGFVPGYSECLAEKLNHPSIEVLGHRNDLPTLMRSADLFVLSSVEEGSALVTYEALASGCVLLVSDATGAPCENGEEGFVHRLRDADALAEHLRQMHRNRDLLESMRARALDAATRLSWAEAGNNLLNVYQQAIARRDI